MSTTMDRRMADRRRTVREAGARRTLRWMLGLIGAALIGSFVAWLLFESSALAVSQISVNGADKADVAAIIAETGLEEGVATINVDPVELADAVLAHPWVAAVDVTVSWPGSVTIDVLEYQPTAWVAGEHLWMLTAFDGSVLEVAVEPSGTIPRVSVGSVDADPGSDVDPIAAAGVAFVAQLPPVYRAAAQVTGTADSLAAVVVGHEVALGHPVDMGEKAAALGALLDTGVIPDLAINMVSPLRPALVDPTGNLQDVIEGSQGDSPETQSAG